MRIIGIDLGVTGQHKAVIANERGQALRPPISFRTQLKELTALVQATQEGQPEDGAVQVVMEPTGMAWFPIAVYLSRLGWTVYLVNSRQVADLRRYFKRYAKSDRIDASLLAKLPVISQETLVPLQLPSAAAQACQRGCKQLDKLRKGSTALQNRLSDIDHFAWPGLEDIFADRFGAAARWFREHYYDPAQLVAAGSAAVRQAWQASQLDPKDSGAWIQPLVALAQEIVQLYGAGSPHLDWGYLQAEVTREQAQLAQFEALFTQVQQTQVQPLYHQLHPSGHLESLVGVGPDSAAVYASFIGDPQRFPDQAHLRGWSGLVPKSSQSANSQASGLSITQAGPALIKKYAYLDADVARRFDPQLAAIYYEQMVHKGKHHDQAVCACATHLLGRVRAVMLENRAYELRDVDGTPLTKQQAREIIQQKYRVPEEVRKRNNKRARHERAEAHKERQQMKESPAPSR
jgi:transposase